MIINTDLLPNVNAYKRAIDFSYLEKYGSKDKYKIPTCFSKCNFLKGQLFKARTTHIYDPSKFWIVSKFKELEIFQRCLFRFYYVNKIHYKIPEDKIQLNRYCVGFIDNSYYRGIIVGFPDNQQEKQEVQIFFIDYGMQGSTNINNIFYIAEKFVKVPKFAIRASLANICPLTNSNWTSKETTKLCNLVVDKILVGIVINVDYKRELVEVHLRENMSLIPVHEILVNEKHARYFQDKESSNEERSPYESKLKYPYLFPSHEVLESGKLPLTTGDAEFQLQIAPMSSVLSRYYKKTNYWKEPTELQSSTC